MGGEVDESNIRTREAQPMRRLIPAAVAGAILALVGSAVAAPGIITTYAGGGAVLGDGGPATSAQLDAPAGVAVAPGGTLYIADSGQARIRAVDPAGTISTIASFVGSVRDLAVGSDGKVYFTTERDIGVVDAPGSWRLIFHHPILHPSHLAIDSQDRLYFDYATFDGVDAVFRLDQSDGSVTRVAGSGEFCDLGAVPPGNYNGDGIPATSANLCRPTGLAIGAGDVLYLADLYHFRVRMVDGAGIIHTVAGNGAQGPSGDGGPATSASVGFVGAIDVDAAGALFVADSNRVRAVYGRTIDATAGTGASGFSGDGGDARLATFAEIGGLAVASDRSSLFVGDIGNDRVRLVDQPRVPDVDALTPVSAFSTPDGSLRSTSQRVAGSSTDNASGVVAVDVRYINAVTGSTTTVAAALTCTANRKSCTWTAAVPSVPGSYEARASGRDRAGNVESPGPRIGIVVV